MIRQQPRYLLFDLDGTLIDSMADLTTALNLLREELGLPSLKSSAVRYMVGDGAKRLVQRGLHELPYHPRYLQRFLALYQEHLLAETCCYRGIIELLERHKPQTMALVTNKPHSLTLKILDGLKLARYFTAVIGGDSSPHKKPHPYPLHQALKQLGAQPHQAVMIGDHHTDLRAAIAAGTPSCFCAYGFGHSDNLRYDYQVDTAADLINLFPGSRLL